VLSHAECQFLTRNALIYAQALAISCPAIASETEPAKRCTSSVHVDLLSACYPRGTTTTYGNSYPGLDNTGADARESGRPVLQCADLSRDSGWYAGYGGSGQLLLQALGRVL